MTKFAIPISGLIQGVSQQPAALRLPGQAELQDNFYPSHTDGLTPRHPTDHIHTYDAQTDGLVHVINRSPDEQYVAVIDGDAITVVDVSPLSADYGTEIPVFGPLSAGAPFTPDFDYLAGDGHNTGTAPWDFKAITLVDYTIVLNRHFPASMSDVLSDPDPSDTTAFLFVRAGQYSTRYEATLKLVGADAVSFAVTTWDGVGGALAGTNEVWKITVLTPGSTGDVWSASILGSTAFYTVVGGDSALDVAAGLGAAIAALPEVGASVALGAITVTADEPGVHFTPGVDTDGTGTFTVQQQVVGVLPTQLTSIETNDIAQALADAIAADTRFTTSREGSVVRVDVVSTGIDFAVWNLTIKHKGGVGTVWTVDMLSQTATYTEQSGDTDTDVAIGLAAAIDALSGSTAARHNKTITITDTTMGEDFTPVVTVASPAQFDLVQVASPTTSDTMFESVRCEDSRGGADAVTDNAFLCVHRTVDAIDLLPLTCADGFKIRIDGNTTDVADDYYVQFQADAAGEFGKGRWVESYGFEVPTTLDQATMPHALIRRQDDVSGTVTGTPNAKYFEWAPIDWTSRAVGDETTAPSPSFTDGSYISDIFFFRGRLGFISGQKVVMSEVNRFFNLFRTTILSLLDGDPIDILVPHHTAINFHHAAAFNQTLLLLADRVLFKLDADGILTPKTVQVSSIVEYESDRIPDTVTSGHGVIFPTARDRFSGVREIIPDSRVVEQFSVDNVAVAVPQYIAGTVMQMAAQEQEGLLLILSRLDQSKLYLMKTHDEAGQRFQLAWSRYTFGSSAFIQGLGFIGADLYIVVTRDGETCLLKSTVLSDHHELGDLYRVNLDYRAQDFTVDGQGYAPAAYDGMSDRTTWTLPYTPDPDEDYVAVVRLNGVTPDGVVVPLTVDGGNLVSADGDQTAEPHYVGQLYEARYRFSKLHVKTGDARTGSQVIKGGGLLQVLNGVAIVDETAAIQADVTPYLRSLFSTAFDAATNLQGLHVYQEAPYVLQRARGEFRFGVFSGDAMVDLVVPGPLPAAVQSAEFECDWTVQYPKFSG